MSKQRSRGARAAGVAFAAALSCAALTLTGCGSSGGATGGGGASTSAGSSSGGPDVKAALSAQSDKLGGASGVDALAQLYQTAIAKGEKKVVIYAAHPSGDGQKQGIAEFEKLFPGITVQSVQLFGAERDQKINSETSTGKHIGDIADGGLSVIQYGHSGQLLKFMPETAKELPPDAYDPGQTFYIDGHAAIGFLVNTKKMDFADAPKTWADLADPKYKGKLVMSNPASPGQIPDCLSELLFAGKIDKAAIEKIAGNKPLIVSSSSQAVNAVITGKRSVAVGLGYSELAEVQSKGVAAKMVFPMDGPTPMLESYIGILKTAPHPDAAKLFETYWLSRLMGGYMAADGLYGPQKDAAGPKDFPTLDKIDVVGEPRPFDKITPHFQSTLKYLGTVFK